MEHHTRIKVYYEDTDSLGVVYYANYLKYLERGRTELVDAQGKPIQQWNREGFILAVYKIDITFLKPARLGDVCDVVTRFVSGSDYRKRLKQTIELGGETITEATVDLVCLDAQLQLREFPPGILE